jgi:hypothetical protein
MTATESVAAGLPAPVRHYLDRTLPADGAVPSTVRITQHGAMRQKPGGKELPFTAVQDLAVARVAFAWRARFRLFGPVAIRVLDAFDGGAGELEARLIGLRVMHDAGPETAIGEALRYLAELPWVPFAMASNPELEWREAGDRRVEVSARVGSERVAVTIELDDAGDIVRVAGERPYREGKLWVPRPWAGEFGEYQELGGVRIPTRAEVRWELETGPFTYWRGVVDSLDLDPQGGQLP